MRWNARRSIVAIALALIHPSPPSCLAGESFLDSNPKAHEAEPYGRRDQRYFSGTPSPHEQPEAQPAETPIVDPDRS